MTFKKHKKHYRQERKPRREEKFLDNISIYKAQNKNLKTLIEKNEKEVIVNTPKQYD